VATVDREVIVDRVAIVDLEAIATSAARGATNEAENEAESAAPTGAAPGVPTANSVDRVPSGGLVSRHRPNSRSARRRSVSVRVARTATQHWRV
jgi:hypothetical protein